MSIGLETWFPSKSATNVQVWIFVLGAWYCFDLGDEQQMLFIRWEREALDIPFVVGYLLASRSVRVHHPYLARPALGREECYFASPANPLCFVLRERCPGDLCIAWTVSVHYEQLAVALVLWDTVIADRIEDFASVRRYFHTSDTSHCPKSFRSHTAVIDFHFRFADQCALPFDRVYFSIFAVTTS